MNRITDINAPKGSVPVRRQAILDHVIAAGSAQIDELAERFSTSRMTIHRDVQSLVEHGLLRKVHGGVTTLSDARVETSIVHRVRRATIEKRAIAAVAAQYVTPGQILVLDDSTTAALMTDHLVRMTPLTVITNSLGISARLSNTPDINLISLGGQYRPTFDAFFGNLCENSMLALRANTLFMSVSAIHGTTAFHQEQEVIKTKLAMMQSVEKRILMVDSLKFDICALNRLASLSEYDVVISDSGIDDAIRTRLENAGVNLQVATIATMEPDQISTGTKGDISVA